MSKISHVTKTYKIEDSETSGQVRTIYEEHFENMDHLLRYLDKTPHSPKLRESQCSSIRERGDASWTGGLDFQQAMKLARRGWPNANTLERKYRMLYENIACTIEREQINYDVEGQFVDVDRFLEGEPECWGTFTSRFDEATSFTPRVIKVTFNAGASWNINEKVMKRKGFVVATLVQCLEYAGYRVQIDVVDVASRWHSEENWIVRVKLKHSDAPLDYDRVVFCLAHPAYLRRLVFGVYERSQFDFALNLVKNGNYGTPEDLPTEETVGDIYIEKSLGVDADWISEESAEQWVKRQLTNQGVKITGYNSY